MQRAAVVASLVMISGCAHHDGASVPLPAAPATARAPDGTVREAPPLATPGEHMQYKLSLQGIELATYDLSIGDIVDLAGKPAVVVQGHAKVSGLAAFLANIDDRFTSWVDVATGRPLRFQTDEYSSGSKVNIEHAVVDFAARTGDVVPVTFHLNDATPIPEPQAVSKPTVWDYNAVLLVLRSWEAPAGSALSLEVFRSRWLWHTDVTIHGKEKLVTELGSLPALRLDGRTYKLDRKGQRERGSEERVFTMWISDDDGRVPLEIRATTDYGDLKMRIVDYQPGSGQRLRP